MARKLKSDFYQRDTREVARDLLGCVLVHLTPAGRRISGRIVETEAYLGATDPAAHSFGGKPTPRTATMYLAGGHAYVFFVYGMHFCFNAVTREAGEPQAVLVRALEPLEGLEEMRRRRRVRLDRDLTNGPGKLCAALAIDRSCDGLRLGRAPLFIEEGEKYPRSSLDVSPRIGVDYAGDAAAWPLRFSVRGNPYVSRVPKKR